MNAPSPIYTRMFKVHEVFGVSEWTVRRWESKGLIKIHKRGRMSFVRNDEMAKVLEGACGA